MQLTYAHLVFLDKVVLSRNIFEVSRRNRMKVEALKNDYLELEKAFQKYKEKVIKWQKVEAIREKKKERRKLRKAKGPRK